MSRKVSTKERNIEIYWLYKMMRDKKIKQYDAFYELSNKYNLKIDTIKFIVSRRKIAI